MEILKEHFSGSNYLDNFKKILSERESIESTEKEL